MNHPTEPQPLTRTYNKAVRDKAISRFCKELNRGRFDRQIILDEVIE